MFGGKVYVAILSLALTPVIARLFAPEDYGEFALYNTVAQNLVVVGTLSLPLAVSTVKKEDLSKVFNLTVTVILFFSIVFTVGLYVFNSHLDAAFSTSIFSKYWYLILIGFFTTSLVTTLTAVNIRLQRFKVNTQIGIIEGSTSKFFNLAGGWVGLNSIGLIMSDLLSKTMSLLILIRRIPTNFKLLIPQYFDVKKTFINLKSFPIYIMPSQWVGMLNNQFIVIAVALLFSKEQLGQIVMAVALISIPLHLLANAFQPVITERLTSLKGTVEINSFFINTTWLLIICGTVLFASILIFPASLFTLYLGEQWLGIKPIINVLAFYAIALLIDKSFENGFIVFNKQKQVFIFSIMELGIQSAIIAFAYVQGLHLVAVILLITIVRSLVSIIRVTYLWKNLKLTKLEL